MKRLSQIAGIFAVVALVVVLSTAITYWFGLMVLKARGSMSIHRITAKYLDDVLSSMKDAETGQRGFLLTGDEKYLAPYQTVRAQLPEELKKVQNTGQISNGSQQVMELLITKKLAELAQTIELRRAQGFEAARALVQTDTGLKTMDKLRTEIAKLKRQQEKEIENAMARADLATRLRTGLFILTGLVNLGFLFWAYSRIRAENERQREAFREMGLQRAETQRQKDLLGVTLASIGDCVIVADIEGRITFMNDVAENVTGWTKQEAMLRPTAQVFKIINEHTRKPVENPVEKVLKTGKIVGLANHTLLIRKDGTELPIDDSGAPIREPSGELRGVVLVFRDFSEHKKAQNELTDAKLAAEAASKVKDQFLAMLSHELRTPLTPVLATLTRWEVTEELPPSMSADVQMMRRSVELEARIIDDLLDLTRIAKGMLSLSPEIANVHELLESLAGMYRSEIHGKQLRLKMQLNAQRPYVNADSSRLQQVIWNILRNAAKFTEAGGDITIRTENDVKGNLSITVTDTGIGMTEDTLARLFVPFEQGEKVISRRYGGLGLGMAISKALTELLGATISATSKGLGQGSSFTVTLPSLEHAPLFKERTVVPLSKPAERLRVLLVEDHLDTALAMSRLLQVRGHDVHVADSVGSAIDAIDHKEIDFLLCDLGLPDGTGLDVVQHLRKSQNTPAIALSGFGMEEDIERCLQQGFNSHITKPVNFQQLELSMRKLVEADTV